MIATRSKPSTEQRTRTPVALIAVCVLALVVLATGSARAQSADPIAVEPATAEGGETATTAAEPAAPASTPPPADSAAGTPPGKSVRVIEARVRPRRAYFYGLKRISFALKLIAKAPTDVRIDIVRRSGALERSIVRMDVAPNVRTVIPWDGLNSAGAQVRGKLRFLVRGVNGEPIAIARRYLARGKKRPKVTFGVFDHIFPVRGKHTYGDGLGAGRGHQGQDVPAACGTKLVAAQGGTVQVNAYQAGGAGYYVVIDTVGSDVDHVYMHLQGPPALTIGQTVLTGQLFGHVGTTGHSTGCHLHFEMWSGPGWYEGGSVLDPSPYLRTWDKYS